MARSSEVSRLRLDSGHAWLKRYGAERRVLRLRAMDWVARRLDIAALRPPPRHVGRDGLDVEQRRIEELSQLDVRVPQVLGRGRDCLLLSDIGQTLAHRLRHGTAQQSRQLLCAAAAAIAEVHARGGYLGAPVARNLTVDAQGRIGFLDFEEDPGEVMPVAQAQTRDWLVFTAGVAHHVPFGERELSDILSTALPDGESEVRGQLLHAVGRLSFLKRSTRWLGRRATALGKAVGSLQRALWNSAGGMLLTVLAADLLHDGDIELLVVLAEMID